MEDEHRELPSGWVRQFDAETHHQFFVDTTANPPRSIWSHPYDDPTYMQSLPAEERAHIQGLHRVPSNADIAAESSDDDHETHSASAALPRRPSPPIGATHRFGRKMKDKLTHTTHEQRQLDRAKRAKEEERAYKQHQAFRQALSRAAETGEPQLLGKDHNGKDVYIEPPYGAQPGYPGYQQGGYGYNPYQQGPYHNPQARYLRPQMPYSRPYGYGYGGGYGLPIGMGLPLGLGLGGGLLMGEF